MTAKFHPDLPENCTHCPFIQPYLEGHTVLTHDIDILERRRDLLAQAALPEIIDVTLASLESKRQAHERIITELALSTIGCEGVRVNRVRIDGKTLLDLHCPSILMRKRS